MNSKKRLYVALAIYAVIGLLIWTTMSADGFRVAGLKISLRTLAEAILAIFVLGTLLHRKAEQVRELDQKDEGFR